MAARGAIGALFDGCVGGPLAGVVVVRDGVRELASLQDGECVCGKVESAPVMAPTLDFVCLVRGVGDIGSAVAHLLFSNGHAVVLHNQPEPTTTRRGMAFADAVFDGQAALDGVRAVRANALDDIKSTVIGGEAIRCWRRSDPRR